VRLPDFARTTTFRWTLAIAGAFVLGALVLFGFVYWQTAAYMTSSYDRLLTSEVSSIAPDAPTHQVERVVNRLRDDPRRVRIAGLFAADGHRLVGNLESLPAGLTPDVPTEATIVRVDDQGRETQKVRLVVHPLPSGDVLAIGRFNGEIDEIAEIVLRALALGLLPAFGLSVVIGVMLSLRALQRLSDVNRRVQRIVAGDLRERLPTRGSDDPFDQLAASVNRMLGEIETLINEIAGIGNNIAHDLRTPLTRVRVRLERGRDHAKTVGELRTVADQAITGLDQALAIVTALLRITEIEHSRRLERSPRCCARSAISTSRSRRTSTSPCRSRPKRGRPCTATAIFCSRRSPTWSTTP
jgi:signal transduction histidine kinase